MVDCRDDWFVLLVGVEMLPKTFVLKVCVNNFEHYKRTVHFLLIRLGLTGCFILYQNNTLPPQQNNWFSAHIILRYTSEKLSVLCIIGLILKTNIGKWKQKIVHQLIAILSSHHYAYWWS